MKRQAIHQGIVVWRGPSELDGSPTMLIATGFKTPSKNTKTGELIQTYIIRSDVDPVSVLMARVPGVDDRSICGDCPLRSKPSGGTGKCYVVVGQSVQSVYRTVQRGGTYADGTGGYLTLDPGACLDQFNGVDLRIGAYGEPTAAPLPVWQALAARAASHRGYTHQWNRDRFQGFRSLCMASVDTPGQRDDAWSKGWRTFRVTDDPTDRVRSEVRCPASEEAGFRTTCKDCPQGIHCNGSEGSDDARKSVTILVHGSAAKGRAK